MLKKIFGILISWGINPLLFFNSLKGLIYFLPDWFTLLKKARGEKDFKKISFFPITSDRFDSGGNIEGVYFQQDLLVAQKIYTQNPKNHLDIGSRIDGFVANVASFRKIDIIDIRPAISRIDNISFKQLDMMILPKDMENTYESISCLHALEHFGLGRYGDPIDINGHIKGFDSMHKILNANGKLYFSTPIGPLRIEFNAHRVFSLSYLLNTLFKGKYIVESFSYIDDNKIMHNNIILNEEIAKTNCGCYYGCGIFELRKI